MSQSPRQPGIVILGYPRSGSTLLRRLLGAHWAIHAPGETYLLSACARFLHSRQVADGVDVGVLSGVRSLGVEPEELLGRLRELVFELHERAASAQGKRRWVEKTAVDSFHAEAIGRIFGSRIRYIVLVRHALDAVASADEWCQKAQSYPEELHRYVARHPQPLVAFAQAWVDVMQSLERSTAQLPKDHLVVRYEELVSQPPTVLQKVLEFLNEPWEEGLIERGLEPAGPLGFGDWKTYGRAAIDAQSVGRWRRLPQGTVRALAPIVNSTLARWGYEPIDVEVAPDPEESLRRYELSLMAQAARQQQKPDAG